MGIIEKYQKFPLTSDVNFMFVIGEKKKHGIQQIRNILENDGIGYFKGGLISEDIANLVQSLKK